MSLAEYGWAAGGRVFDLPAEYLDGITADLAVTPAADRHGPSAAEVARVQRLINLRRATARRRRAHHTRALAGATTS